MSEPDNNSGWQPLEQYIGGAFELGHFLKIAIFISEALAELHGRHHIHRKLSPNCIRLNITEKRAEIVPYSELNQLNSLQNMLAYMSPEQTGRMNRIVDYRSDLYSLGVILYQLSTGNLPFKAADALEWVHCHIARTPKTPHESNHEIPVIVSDIIMKLLIKTVEDRYQSASGVHLDLEKCLAQLELTGTVKSFPLGSVDISRQMLIPQKLYGREKELAALMCAFEQVIASGKTRLLMISGYSGIGKTSLVRELHKPVVNASGVCISGKFDQYRGSIPYSTIGDAFRDLVRQILGDSEEQIDRWRKKIQDALGINGRLITDIIPQLELVIGVQPPVPELPISETENRFNMVFLKFITVFARADHPLVLFFDDLQWVDAASLKLLRTIVSDRETRYLLLIGAYRDNEVSPSHPLMITLDTINRECGELRNIILSSLSLENVLQLLSDTFTPYETNLEALAGLIHEKTGGNPFFVTRFLIELYEEHLVEFDSHRFVWKWDVAKITAKGYSANVVDLMMNKMRRLSPETQQVLQMAACIGNTFDWETLASICGIGSEALQQAISEAVHERLLLIADDNFRFMHDRVQQAAYMLIQKEQRAALHLQIARLLLRQALNKSLDEKTFDIVNQFNSAIELITDRAEKQTVAALNLTAAKKAKTSTAYTSALEYLTLAAELLDEDDWLLHYQLAFDINKELAEVEYLNSNYDRAKILIAQLIERAETDLEKAGLYNILIVQYTLLAQYSDAITIGREALNLFNIHVPTTDLTNELNAELQRYELLMAGRDIASLADEPELSDPVQLVCLELLSNLVVPARYSDSTLFSVVILLNVNWSLCYGPSAKSTVGFSTFGMFLVSHKNRFHDAYQFGIVALKLSLRFDAMSQKCQSSFVLGHYLMHWIMPLKQVDAVILDGMQAGLASGEMQWTGYTMAYRVSPQFYRGERIEQILSEVPKFTHFTEKTRNQWATDTLNGFVIAVSELSDVAGRAAGDKEEAYIAECGARRSFGALGRYYVLKMQIHYIFGRLTEAQQAAKFASGMAGFFSSGISVPALNFYSSLINAARYDSADSGEKSELLAEICAAQRQMKLWADNCPENFQHQFLLVEAEVARIKGNDFVAIKLYEQSIEAARVGGFVQNEAIASECAALFYLNRNLQISAKAYLKVAYHCYQRWGADRKVHFMEHQFSWLKSLSPGNANGVEAQIGHLDAISVIKALQAISGEILLKPLLNTLMKIVLENAGAQKGCFLLAKGEHLSLAVEAMVDGDELKVRPVGTTPLELLVPLSLCLYVCRTRTLRIVDAAIEDSQLSSDPYIIRQRPLSLLCLPLLRQGSLMGVLYLENNLLQGAFTAERIAVLELLVSQAAIALENAMLYEERSKAENNMRQSEERYRQIFEYCGTALVFIEEDMTLSMCNKEFLKLSGYERSEVEGVLKWPKIVACQEDLQMMQEYHRLRRVNPDYAPQTYEFHHLDKFGTVKDVVATVTVIPGTRQSMAAILDITERKKNDADKKRLITAIEQSAEAIFITDLDWNIIYANRACQRVTGYTNSEIVGQHTRIFKSGRHDRNYYLGIKETLDDGRVWSGYMTLKNKEGRHYEADTTNAPVFDENGVTINYVCTHRDVTKELKLERDLRQSQKMEAIGTLAGGIAHDFNNILTAVIGYADLAARKLEDESPAHRDVKRVLEASSRAKELVAQILTFSRQKEQEKEPVHIAAIITEVFRLLRSSLPTSIEINQYFQIAADADVILADPIQIHQVLMNLGTNAAHSMRENGGVLSVTLSEIDVDASVITLVPEISAGTYIRVSVCDTGHGMDAEVRERIFDPYFTTKKVGEGTGMGLAVVQGIVKSHNGAICVYSEPCKGTTFHIFFPKLIAGAREEQVEKHQEVSGGNERILFVDDEKILTEMGEDLFASLGYQIVATTSSTKALEIFSADPHAFDLIITDMTMPGLNGRELAEKTMAIRSDMPIILCTGFSDAMNEAVAEKLGIKAYVMKPYSVSNLNRVVRQVLSGETIFAR